MVDFNGVDREMLQKPICRFMMADKHAVKTAPPALPTSPAICVRSSFTVRLFYLISVHSGRGGSPLGNELVQAIDSRTHSKHFPARHRDAAMNDKMTSQSVPVSLPTPIAPPSTLTHLALIARIVPLPPLSHSLTAIHRFNLLSA